MVLHFLTVTRVALLLLLAVLTHTAAHATPVGYALEAPNVSGTLNGTSFSTLSLLIAGTGDTTGISVNGSGNSLDPSDLINHVSASFTLSDTGGTIVATGTFTDSIVVFDNETVTDASPPHTTGAAGFFDLTANIGGVALFNSAFATYGLSTSIGPLPSFETFPLGGPMATTAGALSILGIGATADNFSGLFIAAVGSTSVPEPSVWLLLSIGLSGLAAWRWIKAS